jgi:uncharacterized iron-regulated membrane protein
MRKLRKLVLTTAALAALAVGGAAFAQAQNAGTVAKVTVQQPRAETSGPGDTDNVQAGDRAQAGDQQAQVGDQESGADSQAEAPESASESDGPDGHHDEAGAAQDTETND